MLRCRSRQLTQIVMTTLVATALLVVAPAHAMGGPPDWRFEVTYAGEEQDLCGMTVRLDGSLHGTFHEKSSGFNEHWRIRLTNVDTGLWVLSETNGIAKDLKVVDDGSGIITIIAAFAGAERYFAPDGTLLFHAAGTTRTELRIDLMDPEDPDDDVLLGADVFKRAGLRLGAADCDALRAQMS